MRAAWLYLAALGSVGATIAVFRPEREHEMPDVAPRPGPRLVAVEGLDVDATARLPRWRASRAVPDEPSGPIALGGQLGALRLEDVVVDLEADLAIHADTGVADLATLTLARVRVSVDGRSLLVAGAASLTAGRIRFPGLVAWFPESARERIERDVTLDLRELVARLRE